MADGLEFTGKLRAAGLRVTRPRLAVLHAVSEYPHADTETVIRAARTHVPDVSHQTVYDALNALTAAGLIRRIQPSGSLARYRLESATTTTTWCVAPAEPSPTSTALSVRLRA